MHRSWLLLLALATIAVAQRSVVEIAADIEAAHEKCRAEKAADADAKCDGIRSVEYAALLAEKGDALLADGLHRSAKEAFDKAAGLVSEVAGHQHELFAEATLKWAQVALNHGDDEKEYLKAFHMFEFHTQRLGKDDAGYPRLLALQGEAGFAANETEAAFYLLEEVLSLEKDGAVEGLSPLAFAKVHLLFATLLKQDQMCSGLKGECMEAQADQKEKRLEKALTHVDAALKAYEALDEPVIEGSMAANVKGGLLDDLGRAREAMLEMAKAWTMAKSVKGVDQEFIDQAHNNMLGIGMKHIDIISKDIPDKGQAPLDEGKEEL